jgi:alpha-amylase
MKKYFLLAISLFVIACGGGSETNTPVKPPVVPPVVEPPITDLGTSKYADDDVYNDVMMQSFWWDTYTDTKVTSVGTFYQFMSSKLIDISNAHIDVVWLPPTSEGDGMGYHPRELFNFNSAHGLKTQLITLLTAMKDRKINGMADLVFNHRIGTSNWNDFTNPAWSCDAICINDEGYTNPSATGTRPCGDLDEGEGWSGARDLNHKSMDVRNGLKDYLLRLKGLGFDSWRYDFVKGFPAKYVGEYNSSTPYYYSVGEYWDENAYNIKSWIDGTGNTVSATTEKSGAFDFDLKKKLNNAIVKGYYSDLRNVGIAGIIGYKEKSVTFLDNHDTGLY